MPYLLNIGNTRVALAKAPVDPFSTEGVRYFPTADFRGEDGARHLWDCLEPLIHSRILVSCVVPEIRRHLAAFCPKDTLLHFITEADYPDIDFSYYDVEHLGTDRIANAAALKVLSPGRSAIAFDCGTAINSVAMDACGHFCGGVILPGRMTARRALGNCTAQLPEIPPDDCGRLTPFAPSTIEGIASGVDLAIAGALERICHETQSHAEFADSAIYLCGGDSRYLTSVISSVKVICAPALTLLGVQCAFSHNFTESVL